MNWVRRYMSVGSACGRTYRHLSKPSVQALPDDGALIPARGPLHRLQQRIITRMRIPLRRRD